MHRSYISAIALVLVSCWCVCQPCHAPSEPKESEIHSTNTVLYERLSLGHEAGVVRVQMERIQDGDAISRRADVAFAQSVLTTGAKVLDIATTFPAGMGVGETPWHWFLWAYPDNLIIFDKVAGKLTERKHALAPEYAGIYGVDNIGRLIALNGAVATITTVGASAPAWTTMVLPKGLDLKSGEVLGVFAQSRTDGQVESLVVVWDQLYGPRKLGVGVWSADGLRWQDFPYSGNLGDARSTGFADSGAWALAGQGHQSTYAVLNRDGDVLFVSVTDQTTTIAVVADALGPIKTLIPVTGSQHSEVGAIAEVDGSLWVIDTDGSDPVRIYECDAIPHGRFSLGLAANSVGTRFVLAWDDSIGRVVRLGKCAVSNTRTTGTTGK